MDQPVPSESSPAEGPNLEVDSRFPSGKWIGFYLQKSIPGRHQMELILQFSGGVMTGEGRDSVGDFHIRGQYQTDDGTCHWTKRYVGRHDVAYKGFNEGKGIWGVWDIAMPPPYSAESGGFRIWPEGMADPTLERLYQSADPPPPVWQPDESLSDERINEESVDEELVEVS